jgi:hypothetical protein
MRQFGGAPGTAKVQTRPETYEHLRLGQVFSQAERPNGPTLDFFGADENKCVAAQFLAQIKPEKREKMIVDPLRPFPKPSVAEKNVPSIRHFLVTSL